MRGFIDISVTIHLDGTPILIPEFWLPYKEVVVYSELELYPIRSSNLNYSVHLDSTTTESMLRTVTTSTQQLDLFT